MPQEPREPLLPVWLRGRRDSEVTRLARGPEGASDKATDANPGLCGDLRDELHPSDFEDLLLLSGKYIFTLKAKSFRTEGPKQTLVTLRETTRKQNKTKPRKHNKLPCRRLPSLQIPPRVRILGQST